MATTRSVLPEYCHYIKSVILLYTKLSSTTIYRKLLLIYRLEMATEKYVFGWWLSFGIILFYRKFLYCTQINCTSSWWIKKKKTDWKLINFIEREFFCCCHVANVISRAESIVKFMFNCEIRNCDSSYPGCLSCDGVFRMMYERIDSERDRERDFQIKTVAHW